MEFDFDIKDMEHCEEIREQLWAETGERNCKINWWSDIDLFLRWQKFRDSE